ncbi:hypothetical protein PV327_011375 [Microctonus hyperodae]|uniref:F-box domain-containing protein n=1 Tax=Microctonus hyperodae TaxID=165561 RepID=A0AA39FJ03_MICHY|nr:hypothetical protein PV327_011375 [Microctonus hyperodae]
MEAFGNLMSIIGAKATPMSLDFVDILPIELSQIIFRQLDERSLLNVAKVSRRWQSVCRGDSRLKQTARSYLHREKQRLYDVAMPKNKPKKAKKSNMTTENAMKNKGASSKVPRASPATFLFGPAGISSGLLANQQIRRDFGPRKSTVPKRIQFSHSFVHTRRDALAK